MVPVKDRWNGIDYSNYSSGQSELACEIISEYPFRGDEEVLDIGSGDGRITEKISRKCRSIIGIDASFSMVMKAKEIKSEKIAFCWARGEEFKFDKKFDMIVSFSALHWIKDQKALWQNIALHLKPKGVALVSLNPLPRSIHLEIALTQAMGEYSSYFKGFEEGSMPLMTLANYEALILSAGFSSVKCRECEKCFKYPDKITFMNNLKAWLPHLAPLPEALKTPFVEKVTEIFLKKSQQVDVSPIKLTYPHFKVHAIL